jgi:signal transduction histidine kinase
MAGTRDLQGRERSSESECDELSEDITEEQKTCIYRIAQEALRNVARHADARLAEVKLWRADGMLNLAIHDDGKGFSPEREKGLDLLGIEERVIRLEGSLQVQSHPGGGTALSVQMPVPSWSVLKS